jgi:diguanylate cyclase (GGDEF)-like protein
LTPHITSASNLAADFSLDPAPHDRDDLRAVWPILLPLVVAAGGLLAVLAPELSHWTGSGHRALVLLVLCASATALEWFPVELPDGERIQLTPVVVLYAGVVYGVTAAVGVALVATLVTQIASRKTAVRVTYNVAQAVLAGGIAALAAHYVARYWHALPLTVAAASLSLLSINVGLVSLARSLHSVSPWSTEVRRNTLSAWMTGALIASVLPFLILGVRASPWYAVLAIGPLLAIRSQLSATSRAGTARHQALTDVLTGLGNRRLFDERLASEVERADRRQMPLSVCLIDLDAFKSINDRFGHPVGDRALIAVASTLRRGGEAFRYGGDEFALVLPEHDESEGQAIADAVSARVRDLEVEGVSLSISYGCAVYRPAGALAASEIVRVADDNLYAAKRRR